MAAANLSQCHNCMYIRHNVLVTMFYPLTALFTFTMVIIILFIHGLTSTLTFGVTGWQQCRKTTYIYLIDYITPHPKGCSLVR